MPPTPERVWRAIRAAKCRAQFNCALRRLRVYGCVCIAPTSHFRSAHANACCFAPARHRGFHYQARHHQPIITSFGANPWRNALLIGSRILTAHSAGARCGRIFRPPAPRARALLPDTLILPIAAGAPGRALPRLDRPHAAHAPQLRSRAASPARSRPAFAGIDAALLRSPAGKPVCRCGRHSGASKNPSRWVAVCQQPQPQGAPNTSPCARARLSRLKLRSLRPQERSR